MQETPSELRTSKEWYEHLYPGPDPAIVIIEPDGWDRDNFQFSYHEEKIDYMTFAWRLMNSKCSIKFR